MRLRLFMGLIGLIALAAATLSAADYWEKKPYAKWSEKEARKMIMQSPWCVEFSWSSTGSSGDSLTQDATAYEPSSPVGTATSRGATDTVGSEREILTIVRVMLFSSRPVRSAVAVLAAKGDAGRIERLKDFAERDFGDEIVVAWVLDSKPKGATSVADLDRQLRALAVGELANETFLATSSGKKVFLKDYIPPTPDGTGAKFVFPRFLPDGTPLITAADKTLRFQTKKFQMRDDDISVDATFKLDKMIFNGQLDY
ncbi:MAG TPA: hypothetical protein PK176_01290 [Acidobacteriota bacterium]|nr:hypothetical protein [Acidobacteriota bacterium]HQM61922.1 hypothetical protein [Acidobacteriota bacterium]